MAEFRHHVSARPKTMNPNERYHIHGPIRPMGYTGKPSLLGRLVKLLTRRELL